MPRTSKTSETAPVAKKTPRKRVTRTRTSSTTKRAAVAKTTARRKAPTTAAASTATTKRPFPRLLVAVFIIVLLIAGTGVVLGVTDKGEINVATVVEERNTKAAAQGEEPVNVQTVSVPAGNDAAPVNGGLRGKGKGTTPSPAPQPEEATITATSSDDAISEEDDTNNNEEVATEGEVADENTNTNDTDTAANDTANTESSPDTDSATEI
ncbi:hypothetical protein KC722_01690 [Candidatus Kaiserbacteria bacterium]|nr:hypothetical protein [Candidatus Kaiserbacteria bacterium]MCB9811382.1 hypothetical protein [Candidatus Nomurabacteria bacterium]